MITLFHTYYNQRPMLGVHKDAWSEHEKDINYVLVDDGSTQPLTKFEHKRVTIARVQEDIPWNIAGARNLGFSVAQTDWVLCADMDHVVSAQSLNEILSLDLTDPNVAYTFTRQDEKGNIGCEAIINILINKKRFFEVGGFDEDFSGNYGKEETFFYHCLLHHQVKVVYCQHIKLDWNRKYGSTYGLVRNKDKNGKIYEAKMDALKKGTYRNGPILRFKWNIVQSA